VAGDEQAHAKGMLTHAMQGWQEALRMQSRVAMAVASWVAGAQGMACQQAVLLPHASGCRSNTTQGQASAAFPFKACHFEGAVRCCMSYERQWRELPAPPSNIHTPTPRSGICRLSAALLHHVARHRGLLLLTRSC
jgi:hypothetical protein